MKSCVASTVLDVHTGVNDARVLQEARREIKTVIEHLVHKEGHAVTVLQGRIRAIVQQNFEHVEGP